MQIAIGNYEIISTADTITVFAMQIGVTRIGSGGRCMPRTRKGGMTTVANLIASTTETDDRVFEVPVKKTQKIARTGRAVVAIAVLVIGLTVSAMFDWTQFVRSLGRILYCALVGRPGRVYRGRQSWRSIWQDGICENF